MSTRKGKLTVLKKRSDWAKAITARWQDSVWAIVEFGGLLTQAKEALAHGDDQYGGSLLPGVPLIRRLVADLNLDSGPGDGGSPRCRFE